MLPPRAMQRALAPGHRHGQPRRLAHDPRHLHRLWPRRRHPRPHGRLRQKGPAPDGGPEHRRLHRLQHLLKAVNDERLAQVQLDRAKLLYDKGAIPKSQLEIAQNAEDDAKAALTAAEAATPRPRRRQGPPQPRPSRSTPPPPATSSRRTSPTPPPPASPTPAPPTPSPSPTSRTSGSSATSTRTISPTSISARRPTSASTPIPGKTFYRHHQRHRRRARSPACAPPRSASRSKIPAC